MQLYIRQKVFSLTDTYNILNDHEEPVFRVQQEFLSWGAKLHIEDMYGRERYMIKQKVLAFLPEYEIYQDEMLCARIIKRFSFLKPRLHVEGMHGELEIHGDFWNMEFNILREGQMLGSIRKKWLSWGDSYLLDIADGQDEAFFCALVIAIDHCLHNED